MNWNEVLGPYRTADSQLLTDTFMARWGEQAWDPSQDDAAAAAKLHTQMTSRITTQRLGYLEGDEKTALDSVHALFEKTREIADEYPKGRHFEALAWEVLNTRVRPFTAKWHPASLHGALSALDGTDEFRRELADLQRVLCRFDDLLMHLRDGAAPPSRIGAPSARVAAIDDEMERGLPWGIPRIYGGIADDDVASINTAEREAIRARRSRYGLDAGREDAFGLALSGGGIRSATFSLGVLIALAERGVLPHVDYLSTVSGGGYLGSFLSAYLSPKPAVPGCHDADTDASTSGRQGAPPSSPDVGLRPNELPFLREAGEADALRHIRHHSKYLATGSLWQHVKMMCAQVYGMLLNALAIVFLGACVVAAERWLRTLAVVDEWLPALTTIAAAALVAGAIGAIVLLRFGPKGWRHADGMVAAPAAILALLLVWRGMESVHLWFAHLVAMSGTWPNGNLKTWMAVAGAIPVVTSAATALFGPRLKWARGVLVVLSAIAAPLFLFAVYLAVYLWAAAAAADMTLPFGLGAAMRPQVLLATIVVGFLFYFFLFDINFTSPHRHYRDKLAEAYLIRPAVAADSGTLVPLEKAVSVRMSDLGAKSPSAPYHLINCALNVPGSSSERMQGRLTDFFLFSPAYSGSPLTGYARTSDWERADRHLDLGTAMAISGAAAAPQMGLATIGRLRFWLALLNVRLGYWARKPNDHRVWLFGGAPGLFCLLQEMLGTMSERLPWMNLSDGGHIENLGVYELLRRRCKYILAIDGEQDPKMTFHALTTLQRLAVIDFGIQIDINLDDLRLNDQGLSRSHFRFCRIRYPSAGRGSPEMIGYLLYLKLSVTGNEGEFLRRYRLDEPVFPHHSTADQFFSETQFEAYRSLGEHVGRKLFLRGIVGDVPGPRNLTIKDWFLALGKSLLEPLPGVPRGALPREPSSPDALSGSRAADQAVHL